MVRMPWRSARPRPATSRKRDEILTAALETFGAKGSNYGSLTDIAERLGMTHAGVLHHFGSKQNLLLEALTHRDRTDDPQLFDQPQVCRGAQRFLHMVRIAYMNARRPSKVRAFTVLRSESLIEGHAARTYFEESYRAQRNEVRQALGLLCEAEGVTDRARLDAACASILAVMDGLQLQWSLDPSVFDLGETTAFAITALVHEALRQARRSRNTRPTRGSSMASWNGSPMEDSQAAGLRSPWVPVGDNAARAPARRPATRTAEQATQPESMLPPRRPPVSSIVANTSRTTVEPWFGQPQWPERPHTRGHARRLMTRAVLVEGAHVPRFCVNQIAQVDTDEHEVHNTDTPQPCHPSVSNQFDLGYFASCEGAVRMARRSFSNVNGCAQCAPSCHTG